MGLTMKKILNKYEDCNKFSLTGKVSRYNITIPREEYEREIQKINPKDRRKFLEQYIVKYNVTEDEFLNALVKIEEHNKDEKRKIYENNKEKFVNYPEFDKLYDEIKQECYDFDCEENRQFYINKHYSDDKLEKYRKMGMSDEEINEMKENFFRCSFIVDQVGKITKYGNEYMGFFWNLYHDIAMNIERQKNKEIYCINNGKSPLEQIPLELKEHFLYYEVSYFNSVTISGGLMINYYFKFNDETKKYLLRFRNDFYLRDLEDLTLYKDDEIRFSSCTHEEFNSIELDYKNMSDDEILDFINDEYFEEDNDKVVEIVNKIITMEVNTKFSFKELDVSSKTLMNKICMICGKLNLQLVSFENKEHSLATVTENGSFEKVKGLPASLCNIEDIIEKKR